MRVEVERDPPTHMVNVYVVEDGFGGNAMRCWTPWSEGDDWLEVPIGGQAPITLRVPEEIWAALVAAGADVPVPSRAQHDHLADAIALRDQLLEVVLPLAKSGIPG
jgi:hypothetical protein